MKIFDFFKIRKDNPKKNLDKMLQGYEIPSFPGAVMQVINMLRDTETTMVEIADHIKADPGMHVMVLKTVNSAAFGLSRKVGNIKQATTLLGRSRLEALILPLGVRKAIPKVEGNCLDMGMFWLASARRACLADSIATLIHPKTRMECFTAALLQDMAIPVLLNSKKNSYCETLHRWNDADGLSLYQLEIDAFGYDHQTVGALMAQEWNLPEYLINAIAAHHLDDDTLAEPAVRIVSQIKYNDDTELNDVAFEILRDQLGLKEEIITNLTSVAFEKAQEFASIMI